MMKYFFLQVLFLAVGCHCFAQNEKLSINKIPIDTSVFDIWPSVSNPSISNDGIYISWVINNQPVGSKTLVIQTVKGNWKVELPGVTNVLFSDDSRKAIFKKSGDSLCLFDLRDSSAEYITNVISFSHFMCHSEEWIVYRLKTSKKELVFRSLKTGGNQISLNECDAYWLSKKAALLVLKTLSKRDGKLVFSLYLSRFPDREQTLIWEGSNVENVIFDDNETQLAFIVNEPINNQNNKSVWHYNVGMARVSMLADNTTSGIDKGLKLEQMVAFNKEGSCLFIKLKENDFPKPKPDEVQVDIWNYKDIKLQSQQLDELNTVLFDVFDTHGPRTYTARIVIGKPGVNRVQQANERIQIKDNLAIITKTNGGDRHELNWNPASRPFFYLYYTNTGERKLLSKISYPVFSNKGKYLIGTDSIEDVRNNNLLSYNLSTSEIVNITQALPMFRYKMNTVGGDNELRDLKVAAWLVDDSALLIYDRFDIWQIDPSGKRAPKSITNEYGRKHNITFSLIPLYPQNIIDSNEPIIVSAFDNSNKKNGFYRVILGSKRDPELLAMDPVVCYAPKNNLGISPIKARDGSVYIVRRESASHAPNYYWTSDFKKFNPISAVFPEKMYNWLTSELLTFTTLDGMAAQGVLYKPQNFDTTKKYPVIMHYYESKSHYLNSYYRPELMADEINIPWFVSNGYIVFTPDIHYKMKQPGQSVVNSVVAAANYLSEFSWVDKKHIGIQGQSFGGYETQYLVTRSNIFAAAVASSGFSDLISLYGSVMLPDGIPYFQNWAEVGQGRIGATPWQDPSLYIENSPIFKVDKVTTPLLMMNNKKDAIVPFSQGIELFTALRRLGKKVWMLQYDEEMHSLSSRKAKLDYTIRMTQFFDHYLKGAPMPRWMLIGIPAKMKGLDNGLMLEETPNSNR